MEGFSGLGKVMILMGIFLIIFGLIVIGVGKLPYLGKLPGDIYIRKGNFTFYFPLATSILISLILTVLLNIIFRIK